MKTYEDFLKAGETPKERVEFLESAIKQFKSSQTYRDALAGAQYYDKHNTTIEKYQKFLYTVIGNKIPDLISADYRLKTLFFRRLVLQQVQYVLGNGAVFEQDDTKEKLGKDFDYKLQKAAKRAMAEGVAFGFWNLDHLEVFGYCDTPNEAGFCPFYSDETSELKAGVRFWFKKEDNNKEVFRATLYEEDGYTDYIKVGENDGRELYPKRAYITKVNKTEAEIEDVSYENYNKLPIVPLFANDSHESELVGIRESIDCYDFIKSGLANQIDDLSTVFWILKNTGGMDDVDLAGFVQKIKTVHAAVVDGDAGVDATPQTIDVPVEARKTMLEILRTDIYEDFQALDVKSLSAAQKTTQEIQAAYQAQDNKCADFEYNIIEFVQRILELMDIDDSPSFVWNRVVNQSEQTTMILQSVNYLTDEMVIKKLPFLTPEEAEQVIEERKADDVDRFEVVEEPVVEEPTEEEVIIEG